MEYEGMIAETVRVHGHENEVIDACRGIDMAGSVAAARESFAALGIDCIQAEAVG